MATVWRVHHASDASYGPLAGEGVITPELAYDLPYNPWSDGITEMTEDHYCGCIDIANVRQWFEGFIDLLSENSFVLSEFEVPEDDILIGWNQVAFIMENAEIVRSIPIKEIVTG